MSYPQVVVHFNKLLHNANTIVGWCKSHNVQVALVGKCVCADPVILKQLWQCGFAMYADSREQNLESTDLRPRMLLRVAMPSNAERVVACSEISLQSQLQTLVALEQACQKLNKTHKVVLMIDLGDLREGLLYTNWQQILQTATFVANSKHLQLEGVGTNLTCYGSIVPTETNLGVLVEIAQKLRSALGLEIPIISGGNSSSLGLMLQGKMPKEVNLLRVGEAVLLGTDTATGAKFHDLVDDAFVLQGQLVEVQSKPSMPIGTRSVNAFGEVVQYQDKGQMLRGIVAVGRQDVQLDGLTPLDQNIQVVGGSSDHLIVDLTRATGYKVGDVVEFKLSYGALLSAFTSKYVDKKYNF